MGELQQFCTLIGQETQIEYRIILRLISFYSMILTVNLCLHLQSKISLGQHGLKNSDFRFKEFIRMLIILILIQFAEILRRLLLLWVMMTRSLELSNTLAIFPNSCAINTMDIAHMSQRLGSAESIWCLWGEKIRLL